MPLYEYKCPSCGRVSEVLVHGFSNHQTPDCPGCGHEMERLLSSPSLVMERSKNTGKTCCGREERCEKPPCSGGERCHRHQD